MTLYKMKLPSRADVVASLVVLIVALPLTLGISLASGTAATAGIVAAIVGGILVGALAGAPLMVSGPAAGLAALVFMIVQTHGLVGLAVATVVGGLFQVGIGALRLGHLFTYVPKSILDGMLAAIGLIILMGQVHVLLGNGVPSSPLLSITELPVSIATLNVSAFLLGAAALGIQLVWGRVAGKFKWIPATLVAVVLVSLVGLAVGSVPRVELQPLGQAISSQLGVWSSFSSDLWSLELIGLGLGLGMVASAESLLCARALESMTEARGVAMKADLNRELLAQGAGNSLSGFLGGLPVTGVIVRSAANVDSGARSRWSTILHGIWILFFVLAAPQIINAIPLAALASVLILTGWKLLNLQRVIAELRARSVYSAFWLLTVASIVVTDLLKGLVATLVVYSVYAVASDRRNRNSLAGEPG